MSTPGRLRVLRKGNTPRFCRKKTLVLALAFRLRHRRVVFVSLLTHSTVLMFSPFSRILLLCCVASGWLVPEMGLPLPKPQDATATTDAGAYLRKTRFGWQDCRHWQGSVCVLARSPVHPATMAALLLLGSLGAFLWATEDDEILNMVGRPPPQRRPSRSSPPHRTPRAE